MDTGNIYKIINEKVEDLKSYLINKDYECIQSDSLKINENKSIYYCSLYLFNENKHKLLSWNWVLKEFKQDIVEISVKPKAIILIKEESDNYNDFYALSFGSAYYELENFYDVDWAFNFAQKLNYINVNSMVLTIPNSKNHRRVNSYYNYNDFDLNGSQALSSLKAKINCSEDIQEVKMIIFSDFFDILLCYLFLDGFIKEIDEFYFSEKYYKYFEFLSKKILENPFSPIINVGKSIKFNMREGNLISVIQFINFINKSQKMPNQHYFPLLKEVSEDKKNEFEKQFNKDLLSLMENPLSEDYDIGISTNIVHGSELNNFGLDYSYYYTYKHKSYRKLKDNSKIDLQDIFKFIKENKFDEYIHNGEDYNLLDIEVHVENDENIRKIKLRKFILYNFQKPINKNINENISQYFLFDGTWNSYNQDFLSHIEKSLNKLEVIYDEKFDIPNKEFDKYIEEKLPEEKEKNELKGIWENKSYKIEDNRTEPLFNQYLEDIHNYKNLDTNFNQIDKSPVELMDLYKNNTNYAVKFGKPQKLNYVIDQSLLALKFLETEEVTFNQEINSFCIWIILTKEKKLKLKNGKPDLNHISSLMFKNKIVQWQMQVRSKGYNPIVKINYKSKK